MGVCTGGLLVEEEKESEEQEEKRDQVGGVIFEVARHHPQSSLQFNRSPLAFAFM